MIDFNLISYSINEYMLYQLGYINLITHSQFMARFELWVNFFFLFLLILQIHFNFQRLIILFVLKSFHHDKIRDRLVATPHFPINRLQYHPIYFHQIEWFVIIFYSTNYQSHYIYLLHYLHQVRGHNILIKYKLILIYLK